MKRNSFFSRIAAITAMIIGADTAANGQTAPAVGSASASNDSQNDVVELSPFTVTSDSDTGWVASASLAGSRMNTPLRDTGASINVLTSEFLQDLGAIDIAEAVDYSVNVHMNNSTESDNADLEFFDVGHMYVRGIPATVTRNYYRWRMQSDSYNVDRVEENRGPNSILFGIGSAGGVINSMTKQAVLGRDFRKATIVVGDNNSYRGTLDLNHRLLDNKLALRMNVVHSNQGHFRHHLFNDTDRVHLAATFQLRSRTRLRADFEYGDIEQVTSRATPAADGVSSWIAAGSPVFETVQTSNLGPNGITRLNASQMRLTFIDNNGMIANFAGANRATGNSNSILDQSLADFSVATGGPDQRRYGDLENFTVFWEERLGERTFLELSHNRQHTKSIASLTGQGRSENNILYADPNLFLPNGDPNPHAGQMFFEGGRLNQIRVNERTHATRLMISHEQDFGRWGNYRIAGMGEYEWRNAKRGVFVEAWEGAPFNSSPENDQNQVWRRHYVTTGDWSTYYAPGPGEAGLLTGVPHPTQQGRLLNSTWVTFNQGGQLDPVERQRTMLVGAQARYLKNRVVIGAGFRRDLLSIRNVTALRHPDTNQWSLDHPDIEPLYQSFSASTRTLGAVVHATKNLSFFYNFSNSLNLPNTQHRILPDGLPPPMADARGSDFGFTVSLFDGRLVARANAFEVDLLNATGGGFGGTFSNPQVLNRDVLNAVLAAGLITQAEFDARDFTSNQAIKNQKLEGYEFNIVGRLTKQWQLTASYSFTDGYDSEIGPEIKAWAAEAIPYFLQWPNVTTAVTGPDGQLMTVAQRVQLWQQNAATEWLREGNPLLGKAKHRYSVFTRYSFDDGVLKGLFVGGGYRWRSKYPTNFDANENLLFDKSRGEADLLLGYRIPRVRFLKSGLRVQLNIRNLFDNTDPEVREYNINNPSIITRAMIKVPRTWRLTTSFDF